MIVLPPHHRWQDFSRPVEGARVVGPEAVVELPWRQLQDTPYLEGAGVVDEDLWVGLLVRHQNVDLQHRS
jgi:hypothetical protein